MDEQQFADKYWHTNTKIVTVTNPRSEDYIFQAVVETGIDRATGKMHTEPRKYIVKAGGSERFPGPIANMYLDQMSKLVAQDEDKFQFMVDPALRAQYYDQLTVAVEDLIQSHVSFENPDYLQKPVEAVEPEEKPFAGVEQSEASKKPGRPPKVATAES